MIPLHMCCAAGRTKDALGSYSIFLFPIAIGLIVGFDSSAFYFFLILAVITVALNMVNKVKNEEDKDAEEPNAYVKVFRCFSFLVILLFVMAETMYRDNATLGAMVYALFAARGLMGLLTLTKRKPDRRMPDIVFNVLWLLFGALMLYFTYAG